MTHKFIDISRTISNDALVIPGDEEINHTTICDIGPESPCRITKLGGWTTHFLTHVDAPRHFVKNGKTLDAIPIERFSGPSIVAEARVSVIDREFVRTLRLRKGQNVLFKTRHSGPFKKGQFDESHVHISQSGAEALVDCGVNLVATDYLSIDGFHTKDFPAHRTLLGKEVLVMEAVNLESVRPGEYGLLALPLKIGEGDGSPVRAVLTQTTKLGFFGGR